MYYLISNLIEIECHSLLLITNRTVLEYHFTSTILFKDQLDAIPYCCEMIFKNSSIGNQKIEFNSEYEEEY